MNILFVLAIIILFLFIFGQIYQIDQFHGGGVSYPFGNMSAYVRRSYPCHRGYPYDTVYPTSTPR